MQHTYASHVLRTLLETLSGARVAEVVLRSRLSRQQSAVKRESPAHGVCRFLTQVEVAQVAICVTLPSFPQLRLNVFNSGDSLFRGEVGRSKAGAALRIQTSAEVADAQNTHHEQIERLREVLQSLWRQNGRVFCVFTRRRLSGRRVCYNGGLLLTLNMSSARADKVSPQGLAELHNPSLSLFRSG